jgi:hypothetical protein
MYRSDRAGGWLRHEGTLILTPTTLTDLHIQNSGLLTSRANFEFGSGVHGYFSKLIDTGAQLPDNALQIRHFSMRAVHHYVSVQGVLSVSFGSSPAYSILCDNRYMRRVPFGRHKPEVHSYTLASACVLLS